MLKLETPSAFADGKGRVILSAGENVLSAPYLESSVGKSRKRIPKDINITATNNLFAVEIRRRGLKDGNEVSAALTAAKDDVPNRDKRDN